MNQYRIYYVKGQRGTRYVEADTINGFKTESDSYVFKVGQEIVLVVPKSKVISIAKIADSENVE